MFSYAIASFFSADLTSKLILSAFSSTFSFSVSAIDFSSATIFPLTSAASLSTCIASCLTLHFAALSLTCGSSSIISASSLATSFSASLILSTPLT